MLKLHANGLDFPPPFGLVPVVTFNNFTLLGFHQPRASSFPWSLLDVSERRLLNQE
jgi:hypothetical protein